MSRSARGQSRLSFTVPAGSGSYAPEILYLHSGTPTTRPRSYGEFDAVSRLSLVVESLVTASAVEVDLLRIGGDPATAGDWVTVVISHTTTGLKTMVEYAGVRGWRIRGKSGGNAGATVINAYWE